MDGFMGYPSRARFFSACSIAGTAFGAWMRAGAQSQAVREKAGEEIGALPFVLHGRDEARQQPRLARRYLQELKVVGLAQTGSGRAAARTSPWCGR